VDAMVKDGFVNEVKTVSNRYGWDVPALLAPGYRAFREYISGTISLQEAKDRFVKGDMDLAKRQRTWFKRNKSIHWVDNPEDTVDIATTILSKIQ
jgi:tRNA dimethylallyltransferase